MSDALEISNSKFITFLKKFNIHSMSRKRSTTTSEAGLVFNSDKFQFCQDVVRFAGLEVTEKGVRPAKDFLDAILHLSTLNNISDVRAFFGMVNQVSYAFSI